MLKITSIHEAILEAKRLADGKLTKGISADEFVEVGDVDGFKVYVTAGKTLGIPAFCSTKTREMSSCGS